MSARATLFVCVCCAAQMSCLLADSSAPIMRCFNEFLEMFSSFLATPQSGGSHLKRSCSSCRPFTCYSVGVDEMNWNHSLLLSRRPIRAEQLTTQWIKDVKRSAGTLSLIRARITHSNTIRKSSAHTHKNRDIFLSVSGIFYICLP